MFAWLQIEADARALKSKAKPRIFHSQKQAEDACTACLDGLSPGKRMITESKPLIT